MRSIFFIVGATLFSVIAAAQSRLQWTTAEHTPYMQSNVCKAISTDRYGNSYVISHTQSSISYYISDRFFCYDSSGTKQWQSDNDTCLTGCMESYAQVIALDGLGAIFVGSYYHSGITELTLKRIDLSGSLVWESSWADGTVVDVVKAVLDKNGDIVVAMNNQHSAAYDLDYEIAKFDTVSGANIWYTVLPPDAGSSGFHIQDKISDITIGPDNAVYGCGASSDPWSGGAGHNSIFKVMPDGTAAYRTICDSSAVGAVAVDGSGGLYVLGSNGASSVHLEKHDTATGGLLWTANPSHGEVMSAAGLVCDAHNNVYVMGNYSYLPPSWLTNHNFYISKYHPDGSREWENVYLQGLGDAGIADHTGAVQMKLHNNALFVLSSKASFSNEFIVVSKIDMAGNLLAWDSSVREGPLSVRSYFGYMDFDQGDNVYVSRSGVWGTGPVGNILQKFADTVSVPVLDVQTAEERGIQLFPNPADGRIEVIHAPVVSPSAAEVFDIQGRLVLQVNLTGSRTIIQAGDLAEGLYNCRVVINGIVCNRKLLVQHR